MPDDRCAACPPECGVCDEHGHCPDHCRPRRTLRRLDTEESRRFWAAVDAAAAEVSTWPGWKRGESILEAPERREEG